MRMRGVVGRNVRHAVIARLGLMVVQGNTRA